MKGNNCVWRRMSIAAFLVAAASSSCHKTATAHRRLTTATAFLHSGVRPGSFGRTQKPIATFETLRLWSSMDRDPEKMRDRVLDEPDLTEYRNKNNQRDQVFSAISSDGGIKVTAATARNLVNDLMMQHVLTPVSADALGRTIVCSILMANGIQDEQVVQITMNGDGPIRGIVGICSGTGEVRGYVGSPMLGEMTLPEAVGKGSVQIVKNHPDWPRPYNGITAIRHGDIDRDIGKTLKQLMARPANGVPRRTHKPTLLLLHRYLLGRKRAALLCLSCRDEYKRSSLRCCRWLSY